MLIYKARDLYLYKKGRDMHTQPALGMTYLHYSYYSLFCCHFTQ